MKNMLTIILLLCIRQLLAQPNTEVYLMDITSEDGKTAFTNLRNISNNEGYDNQPSFYDNETILFSSTRNGQTDIAAYNINTGSVTWISNTPEGSEYSPLRIPNSNDISAIRLDTNGLQRLYRYDDLSGESTVIRKNAKVGYHVWDSEDVLVNTILVENRMDLVLSNFKDSIHVTVAKKVGRSLHKIPKSGQISFVTNETDFPGVRSLNPETGETSELQGLPKGVSDMCWLPDGRLLVPYNGSILAIEPGTKENPAILHHFQEEEINQISRMAVSTDGKHLALVSNDSPSKIVQKQVDSYNSGDLDAFVNCYSKDVVVRKFPADTMYIGHEKMRKNYSSLSPDKKVYDVAVVKRMVVGNKVVDHEEVKGNGKVQMQVAIYEVTNDAIDSMTFIFDKPDAENPEEIVQKQLDAYNARDIDSFMATYSDDVKLYDFPNTKTTEGQEKMREGYVGFFKTTTDLHCEIKNRMVIGNIVIDEEYITANGNNFSAIAIYEVEDGKIAKVTFL